MRKCNSCFSANSSPEIRATCDGNAANPSSSSEHRGVAASVYRAYYVQKTVEKGKIEVILVPIKIKSATTTSGKNGVEAAEETV